MKIHVVIVSDQPLANLLPALMEKPDKVYLACSAAMEKQAAHTRLHRFLKARGIETELESGVPEVGWEEIQQFALTIEDKITQAHPNAEVTLNVTGGTKLMAMGFYSIFASGTSRIIYTDTAHARIEELPTSQEPPPPTPMPDLLDVPGYLEAQGFGIRRSSSDKDAWQKQADARKAACKLLGKHAEDKSLQQFIAAMNERASRSLKPIPGSYEEFLTEPTQQFVQTPLGIWAKAMSKLADSGVIEWSVGERSFTFKDVSAAQFLRGGWLEEYAWHILRDEGLFDVRLGVTGKWVSTKKAENEFDVVGCHANRLLFIECKTLSFHGGNESETAYKVDSLGQDVRGLFGQTWLLSAREPSLILRERAKWANIRVVGPKELKNLRTLVQDWKNSAA